MNMCVLNKVKGMKDFMDKVLETLKEMDINYEIITHPAAYTTEEADEYVKDREGVFSKTLLLSDKKDKDFYLIIMDDNKRLDIKSLSTLVGQRLHFAKEEDLMNKMGLKPGSVSLFGLINNEEKDIKVFIDKEVTKENQINFHPNVNTATLFISIDNMFKFLDNLNFKYQIIDL